MRKPSVQLPADYPQRQRPRPVIPLPLLPGEPPWPRPLPDSVAIRRLSVPAGAPPYDEPDLAVGPVLRSAWPGAGLMAGGAQPLASAGSGEPPPDERGPEPGSGRRPGGGEWAEQFAQALAEALAGSRPAQQIRPWTTEQARRRIRQLGPMLAAEQRPRVRRILTSVPRGGVVEMTVIVGVGPRTRAMAVRLERAGLRQAGPDGEHEDGRWLCTAIEAA
jgi:hypothetical protein